MYRDMCVVNECVLYSFIYTREPSDAMNERYVMRKVLFFLRRDKNLPFCGRIHA